MSDSGLRIVFAGTPDFAAHHLNVLLQSEHTVVAAYTQPDRPAGRGKKLVASPVKQVAQANDITVMQPTNFKDIADQQQLKALNADVMVVVAYGLLLPQVVLDTPKHGCINVHASLLPRWRGAAPIQRAVAAGDEASGVTIMQMDIGLDTGAMLVTTHCPIDTQETGGSLHDKLMDQGGPALLQALSQIQSGTTQPQQQDDNLACYASKLSKAEAALDWSQEATVLDRQIRAFNPFPVAHFSEGNDRIRVWQAEPISQTSADTAPGTIISTDGQTIEVACGEGSLLLQTLQLPGKKAMPVSTILNGYKDRFAVGTQLS